VSPESTAKPPEHLKISLRLARVDARRKCPECVGNDNSRSGQGKACSSRAQCSRLSIREGKLLTRRSLSNTGISQQGTWHPRPHLGCSANLPMTRDEKKFFKALGARIAELS